MSPAIAASGGPFARALREALESVSSPEQQQRILTNALGVAGRKDVPEDVDAFSRFLEGPLRRAIASHVDHDVADAVVERLNQVVAMATSNLRRREEPLHVLELGPARDSDAEEGSGLRMVEAAAIRPSAKTSDTSPHATHAPVGVIVTLDPGLVAEAASALAPLHGRAVHARTLAELVRAISTWHTAPLSIVIDAALPSVDVPTFAGMTELLPPGARVVLWGLDERQKKRLVALYPEVASWIASGATATLASALGVTRSA